MTKPPAHGKVSLPKSEPRPVCPVCGDDETVALFVVSSDDVERHFFRDPNDPRCGPLARQVEAVWNQTTCRFVQCQHCGFAFADPFVAGDEDFYRLAYNEGTSYPTWKWEFQRTLTVIESLCQGVQTEVLSLLDIGAGDGAFVDSLSPRLIQRERVTCLEYSKVGVAAIRRRGIRCLAKDVRDVDSEHLGGPFDIVCLFQVLEHLDGLDQFFSKLKEITTDGAHVFVAVPNPIQRRFFDSYGLYQDLPPAHVGRWAPHPLEVIGARHGFQVVASEVQPESYSSKALKFCLLRLKRWRLSAFMDGIRVQSIRRLLKALLLPPIAVLSAVPLASLRRKQLGTSLWFHVRRDDREAEWPSSC